MSRIGVLLCGHGTRHPDGAREFLTVVEGVRARLPQYDVAPGFLELSPPLLRDGLDALRRRGAPMILVTLGMLFAAGHAKTDIPALLNDYRAEHPQVEIRYGRELGVDPKMLRAAADRIGEALIAAGPSVPRHDTLLLVVGRGSSDPDANADLAKVMRLLWEGLGFGWGETAYCDVTFPHLEPALAHAARLGYPRVVVFPYLLFTGVLVRRIRDIVAAAAGRYPETGFVTAPYLGEHPLVVETFAERVEEILQGRNAMNCRMCKYRAPLPGFADEVGLPQHGAHDHHHDHGHGHREDHDDHEPEHAHHPAHHHQGGGAHRPPPYPHADHPHGPRRTAARRAGEG